MNLEDVITPSAIVFNKDYKDFSFKDKYIGKYNSEHTRIGLKKGMIKINMLIFPLI